MIWINEMAVPPRSRTATGLKALSAPPVSYRSRVFGERISSEGRVESLEVETRDRSYLDFEVMEVSRAMRLSRRVCHLRDGNVTPHDHCLVRFFGRFCKVRVVHDEQAWQVHVLILI